MTPPASNTDNVETTNRTSPASRAAETDHQSSAADPDSASARNTAGFDRWVAGFRQRAEAKGVSAATLAQAFGNAQFLPHVIAADNRQPEFNRAVWDYLDTAVSATRVADGRKKLSAYGDIAQRIAAKYGVPSNILVAIWGMESDYGANFGHYETIDALATLGYDGRRASFAENQLYAALEILGRGDISRADMRGSWAGAMGNTQFIPTSFLDYAVDADGDGRRDIWDSVPDTLASTANYLTKNGWRRGQPWGREVRLPPNFDYARANGNIRRSTAAWRAAGVQAVGPRGLPNFDLAALIAPAGASGPAFVVGPNFRVLLRYNNATSYALAVGLLADRLAGYPGVQQSWPRREARLSHGDVLTLQRDLNKLGYGSGTPDGIVGPKTRSGLRAFQQAKGLTADGFPTQKLLDKIKTAAGS